MKGYFVYARVSTVKQGEKGSSLFEQRSAIEKYASQRGLNIAQWFEEKETAAKQGRPVFDAMMKRIRAGQAVGLITHKIDRLARNLRDWAKLEELADLGVELHCVHESVDLTSRGGRLSADIQAVVAADYIRNLREEVLKGFYGRLKQGLYPLPAPIGYLDNGGGKPKSIDPVRAPFVQKAFALYATGGWSLQTLADELYRQGLRTKGGRGVTRNGIAAILGQKFYIGLIHVRGETFQGVHPRIIEVGIFDKVQAILHGKATHKTRSHRFRYQKLVKCATCGRSLSGSLAKGAVYYRCGTVACPTTSFREDQIDKFVEGELGHLRYSVEQLAAIRRDIAVYWSHQTLNKEAEQKSNAMNIGHIDERLGRLTDAYVDQIVDRDDYVRRKAQLLMDRAGLVGMQYGEDRAVREQARVNYVLELLRSLQSLSVWAHEDTLRRIMKCSFSNFRAREKTLEIAWQKPFDLLVFYPVVFYGGPIAVKSRTSAHDKRVAAAVKAIISFASDDKSSPIDELKPANDNKESQAA